MLPYFELLLIWWPFPGKCTTGHTVNTHPSLQIHSNKCMTIILPCTLRKSHLSISAVRCACWIHKNNHRIAAGTPTALQFNATVSMGQVRVLIRIYRCVAICACALAHIGYAGRSSVCMALWRYDDVLYVILTNLCPSTVGNTAPIAVNRTIEVDIKRAIASQVPTSDIELTR